MIHGFTTDEIRLLADVLEERGMIGLLDIGVSSKSGSSIQVDTKPMFELIAKCMRMAADSMKLFQDPGPVTIVPHKDATEPLLDLMMDIYSPEGARVVFTGQGGYEGERANARETLTVGATYTVDRTDVSSYHTGVHLKEFPGRVFNSVLFNAT